MNKPPYKATIASIEAHDANIQRRSFIKRAAAVSGGLTMPFLTSKAFASSGELNIMCWADELPKPILDMFTAKTGIVVNKTPISSNEEEINKMQATMGEGFDLCMPSCNRASEFKFIEVLKPFDIKRLNLSAYDPTLLKISTSTWSWNGLNHLPHVWGSESIAWNTKATTISDADVSYGLLWDPRYKGKVQMRPASALLSLGLWLDATGKLPTNRMLDCYKDEASLRKIYDQLLTFAVAHKSQVKQFWNSADSIRSGFQENGCVIGQTWDGPVNSMIKAGSPMAFRATKEGALAWMDGFSLSAAAKNIDQAYAFLNFLASPDVAAKLAVATGYNATITGADAQLPDANRQVFQATYPGDSLKRLWWYPASPAWFNPVRNEYAEKFKGA